MFLLTKERREYVKPSVSSVFTYFEYYTHIFGTILFWFNNKVLEAVYYYDFTELFWAIFFASNTVISFGKNIFVTLPSHFSKCS